MANSHRRVQSSEPDKKAKSRRNLEAAWVAARKPKNCLSHGGRVAERSVKAVPRDGGAWRHGLPGPIRKESQAVQQIEGFGRPTEPFLALCQGVYDRGAAAHLGQSRYLQRKRECW
jgi:hypothetical protein